MYPFLAVSETQKFVLRGRFIETK